MSKTAAKSLFIVLIALSSCESKDSALRGHPESTTHGAQTNFEMRWAAPDEHAAAITLTDDEGDALQLVAMDAKVVLQDPLAFTEMTLRFYNPSDRVRQGKFEITLPAGAAISRFAMRVGAELQEAEVVERRQAQAIYEGFLHRKRDPALLENEMGNHFRARVFPIEGREVKEIKISYSEPMTSSTQAHTLPLSGLGTLDRLHVEVGATRTPTQLPTNDTSGRLGTPSAVSFLTLDERNFAPPGDLTIELPTRQANAALRGAGLASARISIPGQAQNAPLQGLTVLFDSSASRAVGYDNQVQELENLIAELAVQEDFPLRVVAFDQDSEVIYHGNARGYGRQAGEQLIARGALGATNLGLALENIVATDLHARVLLVSDAINTVHAAELATLRTQVRALGAKGVKRLDVLVPGTMRDNAVLQTLVATNLEWDGRILGAGSNAATLAKQLRVALSSELSVEIPGASWIWPQKIVGAAPGDEVLVFASLTDDKPLQIRLADGTSTTQIEPSLVASQGLLLARAWAQAKLEDLSQKMRLLPENSPARAQARKELVSLSLRARVLSDETAMLVLENDAQFRRFGLRADALPPILQVGSSGVEAMQRGDMTRREVIRFQSEQWADGAPFPELPGDLLPQTREAIPQSVWEEEPGSIRGGVPGGVPGGVLGGVPGGVLGGVLGGIPGGVPGGILGPSILGSNGAAGPAGEFLPSVPTAFLPSQSASRVGTRGEVEIGPIRGLPNAAAASIRAVAQTRIRELESCVILHSPPDRWSIGIGTVSFRIDSDGKPFAIRTAKDGATNLALDQCFARKVLTWRFPETVKKGLVKNGPLFVALPVVIRAQAAENPAKKTRRTKRTRTRQPIGKPAYSSGLPAWTGKYADILQQLADGANVPAMRAARAWRDEAPSSTLALLALSSAAQANGETALALRALGSIIDLAPSDPETRRIAGEALESIANDLPELKEQALALAVDTYRAGVALRPDHATGYRLLAFALAKVGDDKQAFDTIVGAAKIFDQERFPAINRLIRDDAGVLAAVLQRTNPERAPDIATKLKSISATLAVSPSMRVVLNWEADATDVDLHVVDARGGRASAHTPTLTSGGSILDDITDGYGPEAFVISNQPKAGPYRFEVRYYARGAMGDAHGKVSVVVHDGQGNLGFNDAAFVLMNEGARIQLGSFAVPELN